MDPKPGTLRTCMISERRSKLSRKRLPFPLSIEDPSDTWGHDTFRYDKVIGAFKATSIQLAEHGAAKSVIA